MEGKNKSERKVPNFLLSLDNFFDLYYNTIRNRAERSRDMLPKGVIARKVRASQGRVADNVSRRRLPGKCNRNKPPSFFEGKDGKAR